MLIGGLVSVSFRSLSCEEIIEIAKQSGLHAIEWGSDVHVPLGDTKRAAEVYEKTVSAGLTVSSYGTYYKLGLIPDRTSRLAEYEKIRANAKALHTDIVRIWAGTKGSAAVTEQERKEWVREAVFLAEQAEKDGLQLCFECHPNTLTDELDSARTLLREIDRENVKMYWQPNQHKTFAENQAYLKAILPFVTNLHVFNWHGEAKQPLAYAKNEWESFFALARSDEQNRFCLLEFMPDGQKTSLPQEADTLKQWIEL
ncbi:MAG TPA: hypothetical protein DDY98_04785 [Ruminococcaceae bacterium]|nr:hypothetical protein [Oscillospiraceae bacterium]